MLSKIIADRTLVARIRSLEEAGLIDKNDANYLALCYYVMEWNEEFIERQVDRIFGCYLDNVLTRRNKAVSAFGEQLLLENISDNEFRYSVERIDKIYMEEL